MWHGKKVGRPQTYPPPSACTLYIYRPTCCSICPSDINYLVYIYTLYICLNDTTRGKIDAKFGKPGLGGGGAGGGVPDHDSQRKKTPFHISRGK